MEHTEMIGELGQVLDLIDQVKQSDDPASIENKVKLRNAESKLEDLFEERDTRDMRCVLLNVRKCLDAINSKEDRMFKLGWCLRSAELTGSTIYCNLVESTDESEFHDRQERAIEAFEEMEGE